MDDQPDRNISRTSSEFYDAIVDFDDLEFYLERAARTGGPVLELACGTGRIGLPLAEAGHEVWGIDLSEEMLAVYRRKLEESERSVRERVYLAHASMADFSLRRRFPLIICPFRAFQHLTRPEQAAGCLGCVSHHLTSDGLFIVDVFKPWSLLDDSWVRPEMPIGESIDPATGRRIRKCDHRRLIDVERQIIYPEMVYYLEQPDGSEERVVEPIALAYYYEEQMRDLLTSNGLEIVEAIGSFEGGPVGEGPELIFMCRRA